MTDDLYARAKTVFQRAMERPAGERTAFVDAECAGDEELKREVRSWIGASDRAGDEFLNAPTLKMCMTCEGSYTNETKFCPHCGQVLLEDPRALIGTRLDNMYLVEELLGQGGMGAVYKARHTLLGDTVAIKTLKRELSDSPTFLRRFQREGKAARAFRHANAVTVHDMRTTSAGLVYMVLEYIDGTNLRVVLKERGRLSCDETVEILEPIASVIDSAHRHGVVHRDLKPENVMVTVDDQGRRIVKVLDLGIAKMREQVDGHAMTELTVYGTLLGTPHYMSPEQWGVTPSDGVRDIDGRSDVYSLGVMAYEMVTGAWPYSGDSVDDFQKAHTTEPVPYAHVATPSVPARFSRAVARAMAKDRVDRWPTTGEFVAELRAASTDHSPADDPGATAPGAVGGTVMNDPATMAGTMWMASGAEAPVLKTPEADRVASSVVAAELEPARVHSRGPWLVGALAIALVAVAGIAFWPKASPPVVPTHETGGGNGASRPSPAAPALSFALELRARDGATRLVPARDAIGSVDGYRFVFTPGVAGRLAVIGPNTRNIPTLFLPVAGSGVLEAGKPTTFPANDWFHTTADTPSDTVTVVFLPDGAVVPAFAAGAPGRQLTVDEQRDLERFRASHAVTAESDASRSTVPFKSQGEPVLVDVTVRY